MTYCCSVAKLCPSLRDPMDCSKSGFPVLHYLPKFAQSHVHRVGDATQPSHPLPPPFPPALSLSQHQGLSNESALHIRWPSYWSFSFSISASSEYSGLIPLRIDLIAVQGTLKNLQQHSSKASVFQCSVQCSKSYMTTGKIIGLTIWTFISKVMSLLFNTLSRFVTAFLQRSKHLLISWLAFTVHSDFGVQENKIFHCFHCFLIYLP